MEQFRRAMAGLWSSSVFLLLPSGVVILLGAWFVADPDGAWHRDWSYFHHQAHVAIEAVWGGRPPDLNPWHCAGTDMTENPQGFTSSPLRLRLSGMTGGAGEGPCETRLRRGGDVGGLPVNRHFREQKQRAHL